MKVGLFLGRFQPLHPGHLKVIEQIMLENDQLVVCIGSAQKADPLTISERHTLLERQLVLFYPRRFRIVDLIDPDPIDLWPEVVKKISGVRDEDHNTFYRADRLPAEYAVRLRRFGFRVRILARQPFYFRGPDGLYHLVGSATEIRALYERFGIPIRKEGDER